MSSQTTIVNTALTILGSETVVSLNDNNKRARTMKTIYDIVRQQELRAHNWLFSMLDTQIPSLAIDAIPPFSVAYQKPNDCLKLISMANQPQQLSLIDYRTGFEKLYVQRGKIIYTNLDAPCWISYVQDITDATQFDACFTMAFAAKLAWRACEALTGSSAKRNICMSEYKTALTEAAMVNSVESLPEGRLDDSWVLARISG